MSAAKPVRIKHKTYGTVLRIIRVVPNFLGAKDDAILLLRCRDETYGGLCWLPLNARTNEEWEVLA